MGEEDINTEKIRRAWQHDQQDNSLVGGDLGRAGTTIHLLCYEIDKLRAHLKKAKNNRSKDLLR